MSSLCRRVDNDPRHPSSTPPPGGSSYKLIALIVLFAALAARPAYAISDAATSLLTTATTTREVATRIVEWDFPPGVETDLMPGALSIEGSGNSNNNVWFVTRALNPRVYRIQIPKGLKVRNAPWTSWKLYPESGSPEGSTSPAGGLKKVRSSWDRRLVFVRTTAGLHRIDTTTNQVVFYANAGPSFVSDVAVDPSNRVYWAANEGTGLIKRINANAGCPQLPCQPAEFVTWPVGGGVGLCAEGDSGNGPCLSGVAIHPKSTHIVYFSDNGSDEIGELDTKYDKTRRWNIAGPYPDGDVVHGPRQLSVDNDGTVWAVTGSGHLVSIDTKYNRVTKHKIPAVATNDPFGVAPDGGLIGYTDTAELATEHKVAMLIPRGKSVPGKITAGTAPRVNETVQCVADPGNSTYGEASPIKRTVPARITTNNDGKFVEALVDRNTDMNPTYSSRLPAGIAPDRERSTGAFFYAVGEPHSATPGVLKRIGHARLPRDREKAKHDRDDEDFDDDDKPRGMDDDDDDDGMKNDIDNDDDDDGVMDIEDDDDDNDGIKNQHDRKDTNEDQYNFNSQLAASQFEEFEVTTLPGGLALIVLAAADNPLAPISIEIRNAAGQVVGNSIAAPGAGLITLLTPAAGTYIVKVKNHSATPVGIDTTTITRTPRLP